MNAPIEMETGTGTITASHLDAVVGAIAAGEAAAGTETEGTDVATLATDPLRYEYLLLQSSPPPPVYSTKSNGSLLQVFSQCLTPRSLSLCISFLLYTSLLALYSSNVWGRQMRKVKSLTRI